MIKPPDEYDQILFKITNLFDAMIFNYTSSIDFTSYKGLDALVNEYSKTDSQSYITLDVYFKTLIKISTTFIDEILNILNNQSQFNILTEFNSSSKFPDFTISVFFFLLSQTAKNFFLRFQK
jgi:hypothetical protein